MNIRYLNIAFLFLLLSSCSPVKFSSGSKPAPPNPCSNPPCAMSTLSCSPIFDGGATSKSILTTQGNPKIFSRCASGTSPTYNWSVTKNGSAINVQNLSGADPTGDFLAFGTGTYLIKLNATSTGLEPYTNSQPLQLAINTTPPTSVLCYPRLNGTMTSVTVTSSSTNPTLSAACNPTNVTYGWTVKKNGSVVAVSGLSGANSTPNFALAGNGTYEITLLAESTGLVSFNSAGNPLVVTVNITNPPQAISCNPKINGNSTSVTLNSTNPEISANCSPSNVSYLWSVKKGGTDVTIAGLSGSTSTPNFLTAGPGTYSVYLTASSSGYTNYTLAQPLTVIVPTVSTRTVNFSKTVGISDNQLDIVLIVDDSNSMLADNQKLATRLKGFVDDLSAAGFDWQMCMTLTRAQQVSASDSSLYWGASTNWVGNTGSTQPWILKSGTANTYQIFTNTINAIGAGWAGTDDERAIKAAWWHLWNGEPGVGGTSGCYRQNAGLAVLILSDEDERSVGGDQTQAYYSTEYKALENDDYPQTYVSYVKQVFGNAKRFTVNSIIVKPGDSQCLASQDAAGSKAHYGTKYNELSQLTSGYVGSICDSDFSTNLIYFKDKIVNSLSSVPLECAPVGTVNATVTPTMVFTGALSGLNYIFNPQIPSGRTINLTYQCNQ